ncbi:MAG TPA: MATE family efflux transporter [Bacillota bacterium]|nr:MATE family efflux transporter [Bacillota bacterium]
MENKYLFKMFFKYIIMNVLGMVGISCYILADTFFVARGIGSDGLAALNLAIPIYSFINGAGLMIGMGGATRYSISKSNTIFTQSLHLTLMLSGILVAMGLFLPDQIATLLGADMVTHQMTSIYVKVILCLSPAFMLNTLMICFVRNDENPRLPMIAMLLGSLSNIILDYIFIFIFDMGMFGAAIATGIAPIVSLMVLSRHITGKKNTFHLERSKLVLYAFKDISLLGLPSLIAELSSGIVMIIFNSLLLGLVGNLGVAAYGIIANIAIVILSIFTGIAQGIQPIVSKNYGDGNFGNTGRTLKYGIVVTFAFAVFVYILSFVFAQPVVNIFNKDQDLQLAKIAIGGLRIYFIAFIFGGANILFASYFAAVDRPKNAFNISILRGFILVVPLAFILTKLFGLTGIWLTVPITELLVLCFSAGLVTHIP